MCRTVPLALGKCFIPPFSLIAPNVSYPREKKNRVQMFHTPSTNNTVTKHLVETPLPQGWTGGMGYNVELNFGGWQ